MSDFNNIEPRPYLRPKQLAARWPDIATEGTLAVWRHRKCGPDYHKLGGKVVYYIDDIIAYENKNKIQHDENKA